MGGDAASQDMAPTVGGDASPPSARHLPLPLPPVSPPIGAAPLTPHLRVGALLKSTVFPIFFSRDNRKKLAGVQWFNIIPRGPEKPAVPPLFNIK